MYYTIYDCAWVGGWVDGVGWGLGGWVGGIQYCPVATVDVGPVSVHVLQIYGYRIIQHISHEQANRVEEHCDCI